MKTFNDIYNSIKTDFTPQPSSIPDLAIILAKIYEALKSDKYSEFSPFNIDNSVIDTDKTTIERLIKELKETNTKGEDSFFVNSEGIERTIVDIKTLEINILNPSTNSSDSKMFDFSQLKAQLLYLIEVARQGLTFTKKKIIIDNLANLKGKNAKINYLNSTLLSIRQNQNLWDKFQYDNISKFIELELNKWEKFIDEKENLNFSSANELHKFIVKLINEKLFHNIRYLEGYKIFWRDESCFKEPKKETEIQHFIKSILKPYCDDNNIKIHRESTIANGQIDMTFTFLNYSVCLEIKKAQHNDILNAINTQLSEYMIGEETENGIYMILWYKSSNGYEFPKKYNDIVELISKIKIESDILKYEIIGVDCSKPISPSKR